MQFGAVLQYFLVGKLTKQVYNIQPEAADAPVGPPADHGVEGLAHFGVFPVQVRLLFGEAVEIELLNLRHPFPGRAAEGGFQIVGRGVRGTVPPDVEIVIGVFPALFCLPEPEVLVGGVVQHQIHDDADVPFFCLGNQAVHVGKGAEHGVNVLIVGDIVAVVVLGGLEHRGQPDGVDAQFLQIVQLGDDAGNVAQPVAVAVAEAAGVDLIDDGVLPPWLWAHFAVLQFSLTSSVYFSADTFTGTSERRVMPSASSGA